MHNTINLAISLVLELYDVGMPQIYSILIISCSTYPAYLLLSAECSLTYLRSTHEQIDKDFLRIFQ